MAHNSHHATAGDLDRRGVGDIWTLTKRRVSGSLRAKTTQVSNLSESLRLVWAGCGALVLDSSSDFLPRAPERRSAEACSSPTWRCWSIVAVASLTIGFQTYLLIQLPIILIGGTFGLLLFYVQHQFENVYWARHDSWDPMRVALEGSSYLKLPKVLQWVTGNIDLHHIHHVRPNIPNYNLQQCYDEVPAFQAVKPITLWKSFSLLRLGLYDEAQRKMISFRSLKARLLIAPHEQYPRRAIPT